MPLSQRDPRKKLIFSRFASIFDEFLEMSISTLSHVSSPLYHNLHYLPTFQYWNYWLTIAKLIQHFSIYLQPIVRKRPRYARLVSMTRASFMSDLHIDSNLFGQEEIDPHHPFQGQKIQHLHIAGDMPTALKKRRHRNF